MINFAVSHADRLLGKLFKQHSAAAKSLLAVVGLWVLGRNVLCGLGALANSLPSSSFDISRYGGGFVVITGCTEGIGKAFAEFFARNGCNLYLVSRNMDKLQVLQGELAKINPKI
jgi:17beta-estradiol 17-dehydrogenase / very-long-chain 3-oxoacyl-CoA reductase